MMSRKPNGMHMRSDGQGMECDSQVLCLSIRDESPTVVNMEVVSPSKLHPSSPSQLPK